MLLEERFVPKIARAESELEKLNSEAAPKPYADATKFLCDLDVLSEGCPNMSKDEFNEENISSYRSRKWEGRGDGVRAKTTKPRQGDGVRAKTTRHRYYGA